MAITAADLSAHVGADTSEAESKLAAVGKTIDGLGSTASKAGAVASAGFALLGVGAVAVGVGIAAAVGKAASFEQGIANVGALSNASAAEMVQLADAALKLGQDTRLAGIGATDAATAMEALAAAGFTVKEMTGGVTEGVLLLASATGTDVARAAEIAGDAFGEFRKSMGLTAADMPKIANLFVGAANVSSIGLSDIGESMKTVGPVAASMGITIEEVTAAIAALGNQGIKGGEAGTALRGVLASLVDPSKESAKLIKTLGLNFRDSTGKMKDFGGIAEELRTKTDKLTAAQREQAIVQLFGRENLAAILALMSEGQAGIDKYTQQIKDQGDAAAIGARRNDTFKGALESLGSAWETAQIALGRVFLPTLKDATLALANGVAAAIPLIEAWGPKLASGLTSGIGVLRSFGGAAVTAIGAVAGAVSSFLSGSTNLGQLIGGIEIWVGTILGKLGGLKDRAMPYLEQFAGAVGTFIANAAPQVGAQFAIWAGQFAGWVTSTALPATLAQLGQWAGAIGAWLTGTAAPAVAAAITSVALAFSGWIASTAIPYLQANLPGWIDAITGWITSTAVPALTAAVTGLSVALVSWIRSGDALTAFAGWQGAVLQALGNVIGLLGEFVSIAGPKLVEWIRSEQTQAQFGALLAAVGSGLASILDALSIFSSDAGVRLHNWIVENAPQWREGLGNLLSIANEWGNETNAAFLAWENKTKADFNAWLESLTPAWSHSWSAMGEALITALGNMGAALNNWINTAGPAWLHSWSALGEAVITALGQMAADAEAAMGRLGAAILGALAGLIPQGGGIAGQIGAAIVAGLVNGIMAGAGQVASAAAAVVTGALQAARNAIQSRSPSRKFMELGNDAIDGLIIGMDDKKAEAAKKSAEVASAVAKAAADILSVSAALARFDTARNTPSAGQFSWLTDTTRALVSAMQDAAAGFKADGLKAANDLADSAGKIGGAIKNVLDGLLALARYPAADATPTGSALGWFTHLASSLVANFVAAGAEFDEAGLKAANAFADAASKVGGSVAATLAGLKALAGQDWAEASPSGSALGWFTHLAQALVLSFAAAAAAFDADTTKVAGDFADSAGKVGGSIGSVLAGLKALASANWAESSPSGSAMGWFTHLVASLVANFAAAAALFKGDALKSAGDFADAAGKVMGTIGPAITGLKDIASGVATPTTSAIDGLLGAIKYIVGKFAEMAGEMEAKGIAATAAFASAAGTALGAAKSGVELFAAMAGDKDKAGNNVPVGVPSKEVIDRLLIAVKYVVLQFAYMAAELSGEGVAALNAFASAAGQALGAAKSGVELFKGFDKLTIPSVTAIDALLGGIGYVIQRLREMAASIGAEGIAQAMTFATSTLTLANTIKSALDLYPKVAESKGLPQKAMEDILGGMGGAIQVAKENVNAAETLVGLSQDYLGKMREAAANFAAGLAIGSSLQTPTAPTGGGQKLTFGESVSLTLPALANGGVVNKPTVALIGESGPEAIVPLGSNGRRGGLGLGGGDTYITFEYHDHAVTGDRARLAEFAATIKPELDRVQVMGY